MSRDFAGPVCFWVCNFKGPLLRLRGEGERSRFFADARFLLRDGDGERRCSCLDIFCNVLLIFLISSRDIVGGLQIHERTQTLITTRGGYLLAPDPSYKTVVWAANFCNRKLRALAKTPLSCCHRSTLGQGIWEIWGDVFQTESAQIRRATA